jgi:hypothetical protein
MILKRNEDGSFENLMEACVKSVLENFPEYDNVRKCVMPTTPHLFYPDNKNSKLFCVKAKERFHTTAAQFLYLSKRVRPSIQLPVLNLCSRVQSPMVHGDLNLRRVLGYLMLIKSEKIFICMKLVLDFL